MAAAAEKVNDDYADWIMSFRTRPVDAVLSWYPWGEGSLASSEGPDDWQLRVLARLQKRINEGKHVIRIGVRSGHGVGKAHPIDMQIDTPQGKVRWGSLKPGDSVFGVDGRPTTVLSVHPQGVLPVYRVILDDGSSTVASGDHLWTVKHRKRGWITVTTEELAPMIRAGAARTRMCSLPETGAVEYPPRWVPVEPYTMGAWLGDGSSNSSRITGADNEVFDQIRSAGYTLTENDSRSCGRARVFNVSRLCHGLRMAGVFECGSHAKHVPEAYKQNHKAVRAEVLRGLLDTDGYVSSDGGIQFCSASRQLVEDVVWLARSLGGKARIYNLTKNNAFICSLTMPDGFVPFRVSRKAKRVRPQTQKRYAQRFIDSIEPAGEEDCMCLRVEAEDSLYLANDFIPTHNTALMSWIIHWFSSTHPNPQVVCTANTKNQLDTKTWRELAKWQELAINGDWFRWSATRYTLKGSNTWYASAIPWSKNNPQAFAGTHETHVMIVFDEACHDDQTEVLTEGGWKLFKDVTEGEKLLTMDPETRVAEYLEPRALIRMPYVGPMYTVKHRGVDFKVTPAHKMLHIQPNGKGGYGPTKLTPISELSRCQHRVPREFKWRGEEQEWYEIPEYQSQRKLFPAKRVPMDVWLEFLGWFGSEGNLVSYPNGTAHTVGVTNQDVSRVEWLLREMGYTPRTYDSSTPQVRVGNVQLAETLKHWGKGCLDKRAPDFIRKLSPRQIKIYLDAYREGDGYLKNGKTIIYTSSKKMADSLHVLMLKVYGGASVSTRKLAGQVNTIGSHTATSSVDGYVVRETEGRNMGLKPWLFKQEHYAGEVFCADIPPHHTLLTRRNGMTLWSGNSEIDDTIWEVVEGALTTGGGVIWLAFGNPSSVTGRFAQIWGKFKRYWDKFQVDSRTCKMVNKELIEEWKEAYGEDSDFFRVRVKGLPPKQGAKSLIGRDDAIAAAEADIPISHINPQSPLIMGVDIARDGGDDCVILLRKGPKVHKELKVFKERDLMKTAAIVALEINSRRPDVVFIDKVGMGAGVLDRLIQIGHDNVIGVGAGEKPDRTDVYFNRRIEMWHRMAVWIKNGADIPYNDRLIDELTAPEFYYDARELLRLETKEDMARRGIESPDIADALALTFAYSVPVKLSDESAETEPDVI